jgi:N-acetylglucosaminyl-diphospho-decaprenol L-rhamnosyltransferase
MSALSVDVVIPVHNRWELTASCLEHLRLQTIPHNVIVCDNGSTDGTPERLGRSFPDAHILELGRNLGFSVACNRGVRAGRGDIVVLLNNDVECRPDFLERLIAPFRDERLGSVAALLLRPGEERVESFGLAADRTLAGFPRLRDSPVAEVENAQSVLLGPSGAAAAYRRRAWEAVGGLDEGVFAYSEDVDLALRLRTAGWSAGAAVDAVAVHFESATAARRSAWQRYQAGLARGYFLRRYGILRSGSCLRAVATEAVVVLADSLIFSHDAAALRGRIAGWRAGHARPRNRQPPREALDFRITFSESLRLRVGVYRQRHPRGPSWLRARACRPAR